MFSHNGPMSRRVRVSGGRTRQALKRLELSTPNLVESRSVSTRGASGQTVKDEGHCRVIECTPASRCMSIGLLWFGTLLDHIVYNLGVRVCVIPT